MNLNKLTNEPYMAYQCPTSRASLENGTGPKTCKQATGGQRPMEAKAMVVCFHSISKAFLPEFENPISTRASI
jgi:hypothetical protein